MHTFIRDKKNLFILLTVLLGVTITSIGICWWQGLSREKEIWHPFWESAMWALAPASVVIIARMLYITISQNRAVTPAEVIAEAIIATYVFFGVLVVAMTANILKIFGNPFLFEWVIKICEISLWVIMLIIAGAALMKIALWVFATWIVPAWKWAWETMWVIVTLGALIFFCLLYAFNHNSIGAEWDHVTKNYSIPKKEILPSEPKHQKSNETADNSAGEDQGEHPKKIKQKNVMETKSSRTNNLLPTDPVHHTNE